MVAWWDKAWQPGDFELVVDRVRHLCAEIEAGCKEIEQLEKEAADIRCTLSTERNT